MVYSTYTFVLCFLPIVLIGYYLLAKISNRIYQKTFLLLASLFFYGFYNPYYLFIIISSIVVNYGLAQLIQRKRSKVYLIMGIAFIFDTKKS